MQTQVITPFPIPCMLDFQKLSDCAAQEDRGKQKKVVDNRFKTEVYVMLFDQNSRFIINVKPTLDIVLVVQD